jgi:isoleucyl-tRNA synthetase
LAEVQRKFFGTLVNTYSFFALYANVDNFNFTEDLIPYQERPEIDRWIISKLSSTIKEYKEMMESYDLTRAARAVSSFTIDQLSNWYVRRSRRRFWKSENNQNKISAYQTLYECLVNIAKLTSPFAPFIAEDIYQKLNKATGREKYESVHLSELPVPLFTDEDLEVRMDIAQHVVYLTRSMRAKHNLKVRQPLQKIMIAVDRKYRDSVLNMKDVILEEVNIKELIVLEDDSAIVSKSVKPNFKTIGPKYGKLVKALANEIKNLGKDAIIAIEKDKTYTMKVEGEDVTISIEDVEIVSTEIEGWMVESEGGVTVAVDTELTEALIAEGYAREFVNRVQNMRKDAGYDVIDRINVFVESDLHLTGYIDKFTPYICNEVLADSISYSAVSKGYRQEWKIGDFNCIITVDKV